jgi:hypothetical protein
MASIDFYTPQAYDDFDDGFEWDSGKSERCLRERGFSFALAVDLFERGDFVAWEDRRVSYGESRYVMVGEIGGKAFTVVWTPRDRRRRIISVRGSSCKERMRLHVHRAVYEKTSS